MSPVCTPLRERVAEGRVRAQYANSGIGIVHP